MDELEKVILNIASDLEGVKEKVNSNRQLLIFLFLLEKSIFIYCFNRIFNKKYKGERNEI